MPYIKWSVQMFCLSTNEKDKSYLRVSEDKSKKRYCSHTKSFWNQYYQSKTTLFNNVWVKKLILDHILTLKWSIIATVPSYTNVKKRLHYVCLKIIPSSHILIPKTCWMNVPKLYQVRPSTKCPHQQRFLLKNYDTRLNAGIENLR